MSFKLLQDMLKEENYCNETGKMKILEIEDSLTNLDNSLKLSKQHIDCFFSKIVTAVNEWKQLFHEEFQEAVQSQKEQLVQEKNKMQDNMTQLTKIIFNSKVLMNVCSDTDRENTSEHCLKELMPVISNFAQDKEGEDEGFVPVKFVINENFVSRIFGADARHKMCYLQLFPLSFSSFRLECTDADMNIGGKVLCTIHIPDKFDSHKIQSHLKHSVKVNAEECFSRIYICKKYIQIEFQISNIGPYVVSCSIFNQHISGSPLTINGPSRSAAKVSENGISEQQMANMKLNRRLSENGSLSSAVSSDHISPSVSSDGISPSAVSSTRFSRSVASSIRIKPPSQLLKSVSLTTLSSGPIGDYSPSMTKSSELVSDLQQSSITGVEFSTTSTASVSHSMMPQGLIPNGMSNKTASRIQRIQPAALRKPLRHCLTSGMNNAEVTSGQELEESKYAVRETLLRRPFQIGANQKALTNCPAGELEIAKLNASIEFSPSLASTADQKCLEDKVGNVEDTLGNMSADQSIHPGSKTILLEEAVVKVENLDKTTNGIRPGSMSPQKVCVMPNGNKLALSTPDEAPPLMNDNSIDFDVSDMNSTIKFFQLELVAKYESIFRGNEYVKLNNPIGVAQLKSGEIVVADTFADRLLLFTGDASFIGEFNSQPPLIQPSAIVVLPDGRFAVRDCHCLATFSPKCQPIATFGDELLRRPFGIAHDSHGNLITIDTEYDNSMKIVRIDSSTGRLIRSVPVINRLSSLSQKLSKPRFITFRPPSTLLIVDLGLDKVYMADIDTGEVTKKFGSKGVGDGEFRDPSGVVCDADGFILIGDSRNHRIQIFTPDGQFASVLKVDRPLQRPSGLCLTQSSHLLVLNYWENSLVKYRFCTKDS